MFVVTRLRVPEQDGAAFVAQVAQLIGALSGRPGFRNAELGRAADEAGLWALVARLEALGAYRRAR